MDDHKNQLLQGVQILDLTRLLPGAMCTLHLADMGADVIKIEEPGKGDYARSIQRVKKTNSTFFLITNRNKRSMTLNLKSKEGKKIFLKLAKDADVIVESFRPGVVKKLGIDYKVVKKLNPKIIYCSISGFGQTGPYKDKAGHDLNYCSYAGIINESIPNFQIADIVGGSLNALTGILAALVHQKITREGQYIDVSMMDGTLAHCVTALSGFSNLLTGKFHCYNMYKTLDSKYISLSAIEFKFWELFCKAIRRKDLISKHMTDTKAVYKELKTIFKTKTQKQWIEYFKNIDCCISPVLTLQEAINNEQVKARNIIITQKHPSEGKVTQFNLPLKFSNFKFKIQKPAPLLGEHTEEILRDLGYSNTAITNLKQKGIIKVTS